MFEKFGETANTIIDQSCSECRRLDGASIGSEHLLLAITKNSSCLPARALASMGIHFENVERETQQILAGSAFGNRPSGLVQATEVGFSKSALKALRLAQDHRRQLGQAQVDPEHLLLGLVDVQDSVAVKILEELGVNMPFLWRKVMRLMAQEHCLRQDAPSLKSSLLQGIRELVGYSQEAVQSLSKLSQRSKVPLHRLPTRMEIVHMVLIGYLPELLSTQVAFQRYLLEETLKILESRTGPLDQELVATMVSSSAQNLRLEARAALEQLWSREYRLLDQMLDEAEHDLIGSEIEDLWWAQSEEIALHDLFDAALDDHRRKHVLSLQKRRIEISQRITKLRTRLAETIHQCFVKRSIPA